MSSTAVFIPVGALAEGFAPNSHILEPKTDLASQTITLYFDDDSQAHCQFQSAEQLSIHSNGSQTTALEGKHHYHATSVRDGIYFVDFLPQAHSTQSISLVLDVNHGLFTLIHGQLPTQAEVMQAAFSRVDQGLELTAVQCHFAHGTINRTITPHDTLHSVTEELLGLRNMYTYSPTERYEHIYLNPLFYTWQCLDGVEKGLADVDRCHYFKLADQLYLFVWREKIIPTLGVVLIDLAKQKTDGKICGYQGNDFATLSNFPVGAKAQILNRTEHPAST